MKLSTVIFPLCTTLVAATPQPDTTAAGPSWWEGMASVESVPPAFKAVAKAIQRSAVDATVSATRAQEIRDKAAGALESLGQAQRNKKTPALSLYQTLQGLEGASKFAKLVNDFPDLVKTLNNTESEHSLLVPIDEAFDRIPDKFKEDPDPELLEKTLHYHVISGKKQASAVLTSYTLESEDIEPRLGGEPQRIRVDVSLRGVALNGYSKIKTVNIETANGVIHLVSDVLVPPPPVGLVITFLPTSFSTLLLAYQKTEFVKFIHSQKIAGSTIFAPTNDAFKHLGVKANAFLFNTKQGTKYLDAILKYGIVPNATVYSDTFYDKRSGLDSNSPTVGGEHYNLETFLPGASLSVDIAHYLALRVIKVNGFTSVAFHDAVGSNGVLHAVNRVVLPPRDGKHVDMNDITVQDLKDSLRPYVTEEADEPLWVEEL